MECFWDRIDLDLWLKSDENKTKNQDETRRSWGAEEVAM